MKKIAVTGGSGKLGSQLVHALQQQGYEVTSLDNRMSDQLHCRKIQVDLNDFGQVASALHGADAIVHLAAIPAPLFHPYPYIFANNVLGSYHILEAASVLGISKVVMGSSESSYGFAWAPEPFSPDYLPLDEAHPQKPQECYGLSKVVGETTAEMFWRRTGMQVISLRFSMITRPEEYPSFARRDPKSFKTILWSYIDIRDAVRACIASLEAENCGAVSLNITADDTLSHWETKELLAEFYPEVTELRSVFADRTAVVSNAKAKSVLNWKPQYSWADHLSSE